MRPRVGSLGTPGLALGLTVIAVTGLGLGAVVVARYSRVSAEGILRDYAQLASDRAAEVLEVRLARALYPPLTAIRAEVPAAPADPISPPRLAAALQRSTAGLKPVRVFVRPAGRPPVTDGPLSPSQEAALGDSLDERVAALPRDAYFAIRWPADRGGPVVVLDAIRDSSRAVRGVYGVLLPFDTVVAELRQAAATSGMLPASLTRRVPEDSVVGVALEVTPLGRLLERGSDATSPYRARHPLRPSYGGLEVAVTLREALAPRLLAGGLPARAPPLILGLLGVSLLLLFVAWRLWRQERRFARLREDFVAGVSHELRTPLAQIRLFADTLTLGRVRNDAEAERSLSIIGQETRRLSHLVENLLHFSRQERRQLRVTPRPTDLTALAHQIGTEFEPLARAAGCRLHVEAVPGLVASVDPDSFRQVALNLLDNAVKYGPAGQVVRLQLSSRNGVVRLSVEDQGRGIPPDERARVWERFWRGTAATERGVAGTGIGLAVVLEQVRQHGGAAAVETAPGGGARFVVTLPGGAPAGPA